MTKHEIIQMDAEKQSKHTSIAAALAAAQMDMGKALKSSTNPHFKNTYAGLNAVVDACFPALNKNGIAVVQPLVHGEHGRDVVTRFIHESGETLECPIPLIVAKNDMQGLGSAITYARRYGLMSLAGIAPEDDDGNAAAAAAPKQEPKQPPATKTITGEQYIMLRDAAEAAGVPAEKVCSVYGAPSLEQFPADVFDRAMTKLKATVEANKTSPAADLSDDEIPY